jgi:hypothetical protein
LEPGNYRGDAGRGEGEGKLGGAERRKGKNRPQQRRASIALMELALSSRRVERNSRFSAPEILHGERGVSLREDSMPSLKIYVPVTYVRSRGKKEKDTRESSDCVGSPFREMANQ